MRDRLPVSPPPAVDVGTLPEPCYFPYLVSDVRPSCYPGWPSSRSQRSALEGGTRPAKDIPKPQIAKTQSRIRVELLVDSAGRLRTRRCSRSNSTFGLRSRFPSCSHFLPGFRHSPKSLQRTEVIGLAVRRRLRHKTYSPSGRAASRSAWRGIRHPCPECPCRSLDRRL